MKQELDIENLEDAKFTFGKEAFKAKSLYCDECNSKMNQEVMEIEIPNSSLSIKLNAFRCIKCKKEYLNFEEAKKLDRVFILSRLMNAESYKIRKSLSFDGDNYIFRIPVTMARKLGKKPYADMVPLSSKDLLIHLDKD